MSGSTIDVNFVKNDGWTEVTEVAGNAIWSMQNRGPGILLVKHNATEPAVKDTTGFYAEVGEGLRDASSGETLWARALTQDLSAVLEVG